MTDKETIEGNSLIVKFMGYKTYKHYGDDLFDEYVNEYGMDFTACYVKCSEFHKSWDWLMPAWKKLAHDVFEYRNKLSKEDYLTAHVFTKNMLSAFQKTDIESAWGNLVEFIKWHNQNTKS